MANRSLPSSPPSIDRGSPLRAMLIVGVSLLPLATQASAGDAFYRVPLNELKLTEGKLPEGAFGGASYQYSEAMRPWVRVEGGEGYVAFPGPYWRQDWLGEANLRQLAVVARAPAGNDVTGTLCVPDGDWKKMVAVKFTIPKSAAGEDKPFYQAKYAHYEALLARQVPGAAWFRHQSREARTALGQRAADELQQTFPPAASDSLDDTYSLFTGGRAVSENLQLDRVIPPARQTQEPTVPVSLILGVTVREMDWKPLIKDKHPQLDPLASRIPIDQHAIFFPTFNQMMNLVDEADAQGVPVLQALEPRAEDARTKERYQKQLCLSLTGMGRILGPRVIDSVAVTGSDPYLRMGSDMAILFESKDPDMLLNLLRAQVALWRQRSPEAKETEGTVLGEPWFGARSPDRSICTHVARLRGSNVVVVTNSVKQLERLVAASDGSVRPVSEAPEYVFFRDRYKRGEGDESAFVVLTDAAIRRWCGPRWRIADSRRVQAAAVLAEAQARHLAATLNGKSDPAALQTDRYVPEMGSLYLSPAGVASPTYGSLEYMTPILELPTDKVTPAEASMYARWRDGYQQNWSNYFDPIALRLSARKDGLAADVTVMPLIDNTQYKDLMELTGGVKLTATAGDPHDALLHFAMAINRESGPVKGVTAMARQVASGLKIDPLGWLGKSLAVYVDDGPFWEEAAKAEDFEKFMNENFHRVPMAVYAQSDSPIKLAAFMTAVRAYVDQTAPNLTRWETQEYRGMSYAKVFSTGSGIQEVDRARLYYATTPEALVLSLNEDVIKRALDRRIAKNEVKEKADTGEAAKAADAPVPWLGESAAILVNPKALATLRGIFGRQYQQKMQELAWGNLPILNEWKRLYPDEDPVKVHERLWQVRLVDPAGGRYVWNEQFQTMESTTYGHPGAPKAGPALPPQLNDITRAALGVTFEPQGLRARAVLERKAE